MGRSRRDWVLQNAADDLAYIRATVHNKVKDDQLRRVSVELRRLLVDNELQQAWKEAGFHGQPTIQALPVEPFTAAILPQHMWFASAGGGSYQGAVLGGGIYIGPDDFGFRIPRDEIELIRSQWPSDHGQLGKGPNVSRTDVAGAMADPSVGH